MIARDSLDLLTSPVVHARASRTTAHRPWPLPRRGWVMGQTWTDLLFAHWRVSPAALAKVVPRQLPLDTFASEAWIGITPFGVRNLRPRFTWPVPFLSAFPEINVRTYVTVGGRPGIYFFSLDADSAFAVATARRIYRLPYFRSEATIASDGGTVHYESRRRSPEAPAPAAFHGHYRPVAEPFNARRGSLEHWLSERYCLYTLDEGQLVMRGEIHHPPWPLQAAEADIQTNTMAVEIGIDLADEPLLHYARRQDVVFWALEPVNPAG